MPTSKIYVNTSYDNICKSLALLNAQKLAAISKSD
jgi:hypothetical protein